MSVCRFGSPGVLTSRGFSALQRCQSMSGPCQPRHRWKNQARTYVATHAPLPRRENLQRHRSLDDVLARAIRKPALAIFIGKQKRVESIPRLNLFPADHRTAGTIEYRITTHRELRAPIFIGLLI